MMFVAAAAMMFSSCDKDDNEPEENPNAQTEEMVLGTWHETDVLYILTQGGETETTSLFEEGESTDITFNADKTYNSVYHSLDGDAEDSGTWSVNGSTFTITDYFGSMPYHIEHLDAEVFNLRYSMSGEDEEGPFTYDIIIRMIRM